MKAVENSSKVPVAVIIINRDRPELTNAVYEQVLPMAETVADKQVFVIKAGSNRLPPRNLSTNEELRLYYNAADVVWHRPRADTSSMVRLEAPVIAAAVGGVTEIVQHGVNGMLIPSNHAKSLATATMDFFEDTQ